MPRRSKPTAAPSYPLAANDNSPSALKQALWTWCENQRHLKIGAKFFLYLLTNHADDEARCWVRSARFQRLTNASPRTITYYLRGLEEERLIEETGDFILQEGGPLPIYRLAPDEPAIQHLLGRAARFAEPSCKTSHAYKENTPYYSS